MKTVYMLFVTLLMLNQAACASMSQPRTKITWAPGFTKVQSDVKVTQQIETKIVKVGETDSVVLVFSKPQEWNSGVWQNTRSHKIVRINSFDLKSMDPESFPVRRWTLVARFTRKATGEDNVVFELGGSPSQNVEIIFR